MKCKLGDYIRIKHGFAFKGEYITAENNGVVLVTPGNFEIGGGFKEDKCKFFNGDYPKEYVLSPYDLIVTMTDLSKQGDTLGYSALVPKTNRVYLHNQRIGLVDVYNPKADKMFIYWLTVACHHVCVQAHARLQSDAGGCPREPRVQGQGGRADRRLCRHRFGS